MKLRDDRFEALVAFKEYMPIILFCFHGNVAKEGEARVFR